MSSKYVVLCGVPNEHCSGSKLVTDHNGFPSKCHTSHSQAYKCYVKYLIKVLGYRRSDSARTFLPPVGSDEYARVLTKQSRFGGRLRLGKEGTRFQAQRSNGMIH